MKKIINAIIQANKKYRLIENGDKIAVGVSGGKDSVVLLYALSLYQKFAPVSFEVVGITLQLGFPDMNYQKIIEFCQKHHIEYHIIPTQVNDILQRNLDNHNKIKCSICSKLKKGILINEAKKLNCNKVSMAHHLDDGIETLMMNAIFNGYLASFKPKMYLDRADITFIRPLILCHENAIIKAVNKNRIPVIKSTCPNDKKTAREDVKNWLNEEVYRRFPQAKLNFPNALQNPERVILWNEEE